MNVPDVSSRPGAVTPSAEPKRDGTESVAERSAFMDHLDSERLDPSTNDEEPAPPPAWQAPAPLPEFLPVADQAGDGAAETTPAVSPAPTETVTVTAPLAEIETPRTPAVESARAAFEPSLPGQPGVRLDPAQPVRGDRATQVEAFVGAAAASPKIPASAAPAAPAAPHMGRSMTPTTSRSATSQIANPPPVDVVVPPAPLADGGGTAIDQSASVVAAPIVEGAVFGEAKGPPASEMSPMVLAPPMNAQSSSSAPPAAPVYAPLAQSPASVATPAQLPEILSQSLGAGEDRQDRIVVQLDPPELGRVSFEFKFDAQGLQTVTVSGESPETMRRLRMMHFELVQTLEQHGLSGENLSFSQQHTRDPGHRGPAYSSWESDREAMTPPFATARPMLHPGVMTTRTDRLDLKV